MTSTDPTTDWLVRALAVAPRQHDVVEVDGVDVKYRRWGELGDTPVVLVHGGLAHSHWWDHVAPLLSGGRRIVALDLSGHGDSGMRDEYDVRQWAREISTVAAHAGLTRPIVVGHSMGGQPSVASGVDFPEQFRGIVTIDTRFNDEPYRRGEKVSRRYATLAEGVAAFSPVHAGSGVTIRPDLLRHVAETSLELDGDAWRWKRDDGYHIAWLPYRSLLHDLRVPLAIVRTEFGLVDAEIDAEMQALVPAPSVSVTIPAAGHNPMLEQPLALVGVLLTLLELGWPPDPASERPLTTPSATRKP